MLNRLDPAAVVPAPPTARRATRTAAPPGPRAAAQHSLFIPLHYEPNYSYPLLVWLPGSGGDERQLHRLMPQLSMRNYAGASVRGTHACPGRGYDWHPAAAELAYERVWEAIDAARAKLNIHSQRIFLAGYGSGGTMAVRLALTQPQLFGGALSVGGPFPTGAGPLRRLADSRRLPLFIAQGRESCDYPVDTLCEELRLFHAAGLCVTLRQYPCGDELTTLMLADMNAWLMQQVTGTPAAECEPAQYNTDWN